MSAVVDASSPVRTTLTYAGNFANPFTGTSASFTPPNSSLLVVCGSCDSAGTTQNLTVAMSNTGPAVTWTVEVERDPSEASQGGYAWIAWGKVATGSATTVTASVSGHGLPTGPSGSRGSMKVYVVTGHETTTPNGASGEGSTTTNASNVAALTSTAASSLLFGAATEWNALGTPASSDLTADAFNVAGVLSGLSGYKALGATGAQTMNLDAAGSGAANWNWVAFEVKPAAGGGGAAVYVSPLLTLGVG